MKAGKNLFFKFFILIILLILFSAVSVFLFPRILDFSMDHELLFHVIKKIRVPELFAAISTGTALGFSGAVMQILLDNPLATPFTLGLSSASAFGASLSVMIGFSTGIGLFTPSISAFIFASLSAMILIAASSYLGTGRRTIILIGMAVNFFFSSANTLMQYYAPPDAVYQMMFCTAGSLTNVGLKDSMSLMIVFSLSLLISLVFSKDMSIIQQGDRNATMLGVNVKLERILFILIVSMTTAVSVAVAGIIGFIGLCAPHLCRLLGMESPCILFISSGITGSLILVLADILSKTILYPTILPISAVTSFLGIPFLIILLFIKGKKKA